MQQSESIGLISYLMGRLGMGYFQSKYNYIIL